MARGPAFYTGGGSEMGMKTISTPFDEQRFSRRYPEAVDRMKSLGLSSLEEYWSMEGRQLGMCPEYRAPNEWVRVGPAPRISVIMPAFNEEQYITAAVESILSQTEHDVELIVVDDGSSDGTWDILWRLKQRDDRMTIIWKENGGTGSALNLGFRYARGIYQTWFSGDNVMRPNALEALACALDLEEDAVMAYADFTILDQDTGQISIERTSSFDHARLRRQCYLGNTWLMRASAKRLAGEYSELRCEDYDMHLRLARIGTFVRVPHVLGIWRDHSANLTNTICRHDGWRDAVRVQAKNQWEAASVRVLHVTLPGSDRYTGWHLLQAISQMSDVCGMRQVASSSNMFTPGIDLMLPRDENEVRRLAGEATIIHLNADAEMLNQGSISLGEWPELGKPIVLHLHGALTGRGLHSLDNLFGFGVGPVLCSVPHSAAKIPSSLWVPELYPIDYGEGFFDRDLFSPPSVGSGRLHIGITDADGESRILSAMEEVTSAEHQAGFSFSPIYRHPLPYRQHLARLQKLTAVLAPLRRGYFAGTEWEALAQGLVILGRLDAVAIDTYAKVLGAPPPFVEISDDASLAARLRHLSMSGQELLSMCNHASAWMRTYLAPSAVMRMYESVYLTAARHASFGDYGLISPRSVGLARHPR
jgi:hypothetical protein